MKVIDARVEWNERWSNNPELCVLVDHIPAFSEMRYQHVGQLWWAELDGYVSFFAWKGPGNEGGLGGAQYTITLTDETQVTLKGPWVSRAGVMNKHFDPCLDVVLFTVRDAFEKGGGLAGAITLELAKEALKFCPGVKLLKVTYQDDYFAGETLYIPTKDGTLKQLTQGMAKTIEEVT